jgi:uncharacterized membrane protein YoaK (UPF0700 family)
MTGNLVLLGVAIGQGQLAGSIRAVVAFASFVAGLFLAAQVTSRTEPPSVWPRSATLALLGELGLLVGLLAGWDLAGDRPSPVALDILIALSAGAMGMQSAAARRVGVAGVTTTFVTGMLANLVADLATVRSGQSHRAIWVGTLVCLVIGAAIGAAVFMAWRPGAPLVAVVAVGTVIGVAIFHRDQQTSDR